MDGLDAHTRIDIAIFHPLLLLLLEKKRKKRKKEREWTRGDGERMDGWRKWNGMEVGMKRAETSLPTRLLLYSITHYYHND